MNAFFQEIETSLVSETFWHVFNCVTSLTDKNMSKYIEMDNEQRCQVTKYKYFVTVLK